MRKPYLVAAIAAVGLAATGSWAWARSPLRGVERPGLVVNWKKRLGEANEHLIQSNWKKGEVIADSVLREMRSRIVSGDGSGPLLASALFFRAVAKAGLGDLDSAAWDFGTAQTLHPEYSEVDLQSYGDIAKAMEPWRYSNGSPPLFDQASRPDAASAPEVTPPRKLDGNEPVYPYAKAQNCVQQPIVVKVIIDERGIPKYPSVVDGTDPVLALAAFDALRTWRFAPALRNGEPIPVFFTLSVNFRTPGCH